MSAAGGGPVLVRIISRAAFGPQAIVEPHLQQTPSAANAIPAIFCQIRQALRHKVCVSLSCNAASKLALRVCVVTVGVSAGADTRCRCGSGCDAADTSLGSGRIWERSHSALIGC